MLQPLGVWARHATGAYAARMLGPVDRRPNLVFPHPDYKYANAGQTRMYYFSMRVREMGPMREMEPGPLCFGG